MKSNVADQAHLSIRQGDKASEEKQKRLKAAKEEELKRPLTKKSRESGES